MGQIIGLDGQPLKSNEEEKKEEDASEVMKAALAKQTEFKTPRSVEKALEILQKNGYGYCVILINKQKTATKVDHNIKHPNAEAMIHQTINRHFNTPQS